MLVRVHYSSLNYKDGLSCIGAKGVTREYPHTRESMPQELSSRAVPTNSNPGFGDRHQLRSRNEHFRGFGQFIRVPSRLGGAFARRDDVEGEHGLRNRRIHRRTFRKRTPAPGLTPEQGPIVVTGPVEESVVFQ